MRALIASGALVLAVFLATVPLPRVDGHIVGSDGMYYFAILRSLVVDRDLDLTNDYALLGVTGAASAPTGRPACPWAIGSALLWSPFYLLALALSRALELAGLAAPSAGVGLLPEVFISAFSILYATAGLLLAYRAARRLVRDDGAAVLAALAAWWATSLLEYTVAEPSMSHALSFFANALFLALWTAPSTRALTAGRCALLGASAALVALVRWQDGLVLLVPLAELGVAAVRAARRGAPGWAREAAWRLAACVAAFVVGFVPQMLMWQSIYGSYLTVPQGEGFMAWTAPHVLGVLFSPRHGLVTWHPVTLLMLAGLVPLARRQPGLACAVGGLFVAQVYVNAATSDWWGGDAFGGRRFICLLPWLVLPLAALLDGFPRGTPARRVAVGALVALTLWNGLSFVQYRLGFVPRGEALTWRQLTVDRLLLPARLAGRLRGPAAPEPGGPAAHP